jgi:hypothetical protein
VTGPGPIWLQSLPFSRLAGSIHTAASLLQGVPNSDFALQLFFFVFQVQELPLGYTGQGADTQKARKGCFGDSTCFHSVDFIDLDAIGLCKKSVPNLVLYPDEKDYNPFLELKQI